MGWFMDFPVKILDAIDLEAIALLSFVSEVALDPKNGENDLKFDEMAFNGMKTYTSLGSIIGFWRFVEVKTIASQCYRMCIKLIRSKLDMEFYPKAYFVSSLLQLNSTAISKKNIDEDSLINELRLIYLLIDYISKDLIKLLELIIEAIKAKIIYSKQFKDLEMKNIIYSLRQLRKKIKKRKAKEYEQ
ncbi:MAG: hypothetical protein MHPSP_002806, partial [Paramarteilia canceri]